MQRLFQQGTVHGVNSLVLHAKFGECFLQHVHGAESGHLRRDEGRRQFARMNAPVTVGEVLEEKFVERRSVKLDERFLGVLRNPGNEGLAELRVKQAEGVEHELEERDAADHVLKLERVAIEASSPADFRVEFDGDALVAHQFHDVLVYLPVEFMEHVAAHVIPVLAALVRGGETARTGIFFDQRHRDARTAENARGV